MSWSIRMTNGEQREALLAGRHIGVLAVHREERAPLAVPTGYGYQPGAKS